MNEYINNSNEAKVLKGTIGEIHIDKRGNVVKIVGGQTEEGICYKDLDAWENSKGIIYIGENGINDFNSGSVELEDVVWTRDSWIDYVADELSYYQIGCENDMGFVAYIAESILCEAEWEDLSTRFDVWLDDNGLEETWDEWCDKH